MAIFQKSRDCQHRSNSQVKRRSSATKVSRPGYQAFPAAVKCLPLTAVAMEMGRKRPPEPAHPEAKAGRDPRKVDRGGIGLQIEVPGSRRCTFPAQGKWEMPFFFSNEGFQRRKWTRLKSRRKRTVGLEIKLMARPNVLDGGENCEMKSILFKCLKI